VNNEIKFCNLTDVEGKKTIEALKKMAGRLPPNLKFGLCTCNEVRDVNARRYEVVIMASNRCKSLQHDDSYAVESLGLTFRVHKPIDNCLPCHRQTTYSVRPQILGVVARASHGRGVPRQGLAC